MNQPFPQIESQPKSRRPVIALLLSLSSLLFCCAYFAVNPEGFDHLSSGAYTPLVLASQALLCVGALLPLAGTVLGFLSLKANEANRNMSIAAIVFGLPAFILSAAIFGFMLFLYVVGSTMSY